MAEREIPGFGIVDIPEDWDEPRTKTELANWRKQYGISVPETSQYHERITAKAKEYGIDPHLALRVAGIESNFNPSAYNPKAGAAGLYQMIPGTAKEMGVTNVYDADQSIAGGLGYYKKMLDKYNGDQRLAIAAYNWGPGNVDKMLARTDKEFNREKWEQHTPAETQAYLRRAFPFGQAPIPQRQVLTPTSTATNEQVAQQARDEYMAETARRPGFKEEEPWSPVSSYAAGMGQKVLRSGRALGFDRLLSNLGMIKPDDTRDAEINLARVASDNPKAGLLGNVVAGVAEAAPAARVASSLKYLPLVGSKLGGPVTQAALGSTVQSMATTPGDLKTRATETAKDLAVTLPLAVGSKFVAQPFKMNKDAEDLRKLMGPDAPYPPLSVGAESKATRDIGTLTGQIPGLGRGQAAAERGFQDAATQELWRRATPEGMDNLLAQRGGTASRGQLFKELDDQIKQSAYAAVGKSHIPVADADVATLRQFQRGLSGPMAREYSNALDAAVTRHFPNGNGVFMGPGYAQARRDLIQKIEEYSNRGSVEGREVSARLKMALQYMDQLGATHIGSGNLRQLQQLDQSIKYRDMLESAVGFKGGDKGVTPRILDQAMRAESAKGRVSRSQGVGQDIIDPLNRVMEPASIHNPLQLSDLSRRSYPLIASGLLATGGGALPLLGANAAANIGSGFRPVAKALYGDTAAQRKLAELVKNHPAFMGALMGETRGVE